MQKATNFFEDKYSQFLNIENVDGGEFGNWILIDRIDHTTEEALDVTLDTGKASKIKVVLNNVYISSGAAISLYARPNADASGYLTVSQMYGTTLTTSVGSANSNGIYLGSAALTTGGSSECVIYTKKTGSRRFGLQDGFYHVQSGIRRGIKSATEWSNVDDDVESIQVHSNGYAFFGTVEVYAWQEIKPIELHTYELAKEITATGIVDETIDWDGEEDSEIRIVVDGLGEGLDSALGLQLNGDTGSNYRRQRSQASGSTVLGQRDVGTNVYLTYNTLSSSSEIKGNLKVDGGSRQFLSTHCYIGTDANIGHISESVDWTNTTDPVTSVRIFSTSTGGFTGTIKVYKLAKSHLITSNPGLLNGMRLKSIDGDTVEVGAGEIEINGSICTNKKPISVTLSGNLRASETESADTYYYLYAVKGTGQSITFSFSAVKPMIDRYGNAVEFEGDDLYHPEEGRTWRYVGQVWNNSNGDILQFEKCYPGYWEGTYEAFTANSLMTFSHGLGRLALRPRLLFKTSIEDDSTYIMSDFFSTTESRGVFWRDEVTETAISAFFGDEPFGTAAGFQTTGYCKLIVKDN